MKMRVPQKGQLTGVEGSEVRRWKAERQEMDIMSAVDVSDVQAHEAATHANVTLGGYDMDGCCPLSEFKAFKVKLEASDIDRLFLLNCGFAAHTEGQTCKLRDVLPGVVSDERVRNVIDKACFPVSPDQAILIVSPDEKCGPLTIYDGNHRAMAQYLTQKSVHDVLAYVCVHRRISEWRFVPPQGRK